ncbi:MAG TPA: hypothetical protein VH392_00665 [Sphingomicrobium sp.]|jgi:hypothetical protein
MTEAPATKKARLVRLSDALKARDWLGLLLELAVVTIGVLLAFEIEQWGQRRNQARQERDFLERFYVENQASARELTELLQVHHRVISELGAAIRARNDPVKLDQISQQRDFGCKIAYMQTAAYNDTAFDELLASGRLNLISDLELRSLVRQLAASQALGAAVAEHGRMQLPYTLPNLNPYYTVTIDERDVPACHFDWRALARDPVAVTSVARLVARHRLISDAREDTLQLTRRVEGRLACVLKKRSC